MTDVTLVAGTYVEWYDITTGTWKRVPRLTSVGETGYMADAKEKTTVEDRFKRYGVGIRDGGEKNFMGQYVPPQTEGSEHTLDQGLQQEWLNQVDMETEMEMRTTFPNLRRSTYTFQALGYKFEDGNQEEWVMFDAMGRQNGRPVWTDAPELSAIVLAGEASMGVGDGEQLTVTNTPLDAYYEVNEDRFASSAPAIVSVTKWGYVRAIASGTAMITVTRGLQTDTFEITVS